MKYFSLLILLFIRASFSVAQHSSEELLSELVTAIENKDVYISERINRIDALKKQFYKHQSYDTIKFNLATRVYEEYRVFKYDSAFTYAQKAKDIAVLIKDPEKLELAKLNLAFIHNSSGMFKEGFEILDNIHPALLNSSAKVEFYFTKARSYSDLADFNLGNYYRPAYIEKAITYVDTALLYSPANSYETLSLQGFRALKSGDLKTSEAIFDKILRLPTLTLHQLAINASTAAWVHELAGDQDRAFELLLRASIADVKSATTETVALFRLSDLCYRRGDLKNAYTFINQAQEDALFYNSRLRQIQIGNIFSTIEGQRISIIENQRRTLTIYAAAVTLLVLLVIAFAVVVFKQLKKLQRADAIISTINQELQANNQYLHQLNYKLSEVNRIKDEYIGYYLTISSEYIDKIENTKHTLNKTLINKKYDSTQKIVDSINIKKERDQLFKGFDSVFLKLFPDFIASFNALLKPEERITLGENQLLNSELRIFALIRLGIDDNERISRLLGYTISTIYTYKTRVKNKSIYPNDEFESRVRAIQAA